MAYFIQKPSLIDKNLTVYYAGDNRWTDDKFQKLKFSTKKKATSLIANADGKNGGWTNAKILSE